MIGGALVLVAWLTAPIPCVDDCDAHCGDCRAECLEACDLRCDDARCTKTCVLGCDGQCGACRRFCKRRLQCDSGSRGHAQSRVAEGRAIEPGHGHAGNVVVLEGDVAEAPAAARGERDDAGRAHAAECREELTQGIVVGVLGKTTYVQRTVL